MCMLNVYGELFLITYRMSNKMIWYWTFCLFTRCRVQINWHIL